MAIGYEGAPVTQVLSVIILAFSLFLRSYHDALLFVYNQVLQGQVLRLLCSQFIFANIAQTFVGLSMMYVCRQFERQLGSRKFGAFTFLSFFLSMVMTLSMGAFTQSMDIEYSPSPGPYTYIFSLLVLFYAYVPKSAPSKYVILGLPLSDKTWTYIFGAQLFFNDMEKSAGPSIIGILIGMLYLGNHFGMQSWRLPSIVEKIFISFGSIFSFMMPAPPSNPTRAAATGNAGDAGTAPGDDDEPPRYGRQPSWSEETQERLHSFGGMGEAIDPPSEDQIASIMALGFERARAIHALEQCENNVEAAANFLLR